MAVDEVLLDAAVAGETCTLRCYRWERPTVSLGYFQDSTSASQLPELRDLPIVRRLTGGGAIVHDDELTYACALPASHPLASAPRDLYTCVHRRVIDVLAEFGVAATLRGNSEVDRSREFLCFGRGDDFDVVFGGAKILGSAQRRRKGAILQHGSLLLRRSRHALKFPGILDLTKDAFDAAVLAWRLSDRIADLLSENPIPSSLSEDEVAKARRLESESLQISPARDDSV